ncbi:tpr domain containing protein [Stylonychia lemnae]|uniref:Tpr domain containing protein n=1 Tax=Stylonychia lemnae TaxID=5949 RepID=A0A078ADH0_STYLE|nr:tpr domain containing protein [Stylonychia lemnae]|eukprot:CDW79587.1 tpr domain containing protein [Stylonychia lemnae]
MRKTEHQMNLLEVKDLKEQSKLGFSNQRFASEAYLNFKYYEQALDHLTTALKLNGSLFSKLEETKQFHSHILTLLGKCYMEAGNHKDALSLIEKSLKMNKQVQGEDHPSNCTIMIAMAHVYLKMKDFDNATNTLFTVWEISQAKFGDNSEEVGQAYYELANAHLKKKDYNEAIKYQRKALQVYQGLENFRDSDHIANIAITLSKWLEIVEQIDEALEALKQAEQIYEYNYSVVDKRTCKVKRNIALLFLKANKYDEALEELKEVEELEKSLYGDNSVQLGKTFKVIGTLYLINSNPSEARDYLMRAHSIFESKGLLKLLKEVKNKLKMLNSTVKLAADAVAAEALDSGDDSGQGSPERKSAEAAFKAKKKKGLKKKVKKTVFRNNFIKESDSNQAQ